MSKQFKWTKQADTPEKIQEIYPTVWNDSIVVAGGLRNIDSGFIPTDSAFIFNPQTANWEPSTKLPQPRHHPQLSVLGDRLYAIGGFTLEDQTRQWVMQADGWSRTENGNWEPAPALPNPGAEGLIFSQNDRLHLIGGRTTKAHANGLYTDHVDVVDHFTLDAGNTEWERARAAPTARNSAAGAIVDGRFYLISGRNMEEGNVTTVECYDPHADSWETLRPVPQAQAGNAAGVIGGRIVMFGGEYNDASPSGVFVETWIYDPTSDQWEAGPDMGTPRHGLGAVTIKDVIYTFGGAAHWGAEQTTSTFEVLRNE